jgi:hypothetical protein
VQLDEVDLLDAEVGARAVVPGEEVLPVVVLRSLLDAPTHLSCDEHLGLAAVQLGAELLAAAVAVDVRGVKEGDARRDGAVKHRAGALGADAAPVGA